MGKVYVAAFFLPVPVMKRLTDVGWEFESSTRLPERLIAVLKDVFRVQRGETYLGMDVYEGNRVKFTIVRDSIGEIEHVAVQLRGLGAEELRAALVSARLTNIEVFVPSRSDA